MFGTLTQRRNIMNQNPNGRCIAGAALIVFTLAFLWLQLPELLAGVRGDPLSSLRLIAQPSSEWANTSDWRGLLFIYEGRGLWWLMHACCPGIDSYLNDFLPMFSCRLGVNPAMLGELGGHGITYSMVFLVYSIWGFYTAVCYVLFCLLIYSMRKDVWKMLLFLSFLIISFAFIRHFHYALFYKYLDGLFYPLAISALIGAYFCISAQGKRKYAWFLFVLICLFHCVGYRRMAIFTLPVFCYWLMPVVYSPKKWMLRAFSACVLGGLFGLSTLSLIQRLPSVHAHKAIIMMYSDLYMTGILSGNWEHFKQLEKEGGISGVHNHKSSAQLIPLGQLYFGAHLTKGDTDENWQQFVRTYCRFVCRYPRAYVCSRVISMLQFYCNFHVPNICRKAVAALCPEATLSQTSWSAEPCNLHDSGGKYEKVYLFAASLLTLCFLMWRRAHLDEEMRQFVFFALVGGAYSLSFMLVVPTPDARYHSFPVMAQCLFLSYVAARAINNIIQRMLNIGSVTPEC